MFAPCSRKLTEFLAQLAGRWSVSSTLFVHMVLSCSSVFMGRESWRISSKRQKIKITTPGIFIFHILPQNSQASQVNAPMFQHSKESNLEDDFWYLKMSMQSQTELVWSHRTDGINRIDWKGYRHLSLLNAVLMSHINLKIYQIFRNTFTFLKKMLEDAVQGSESRPFTSFYQSHSNLLWRQDRNSDIFYHPSWHQLTQLHQKAKHTKTNEYLVCFKKEN